MQSLTKSPIVGNVKLEIHVMIGRSRLTLSDILQLSKGKIIPLDVLATDPVEVYIGDRLVAFGELEEMDATEGKRLGVRLIEVNGHDS